MENSIQLAIEKWRQVVGTENVLSSAAALSSYATTTTAVEMRIAGVLRPVSEGEVQQIVEIARQHRIPVYPTSTGRNWGYGCGNPPRHDCVVVDLSRMNCIIALSVEEGTTTIEPGVTQGQLALRLDQDQAPLLVPVTGAGPDVSLVGNALERGYGLTPYSDHFSAVIRIRAVLADGSIYQSPLAELDDPSISRLHKWGIGPYLDGLFSQGNFGIVTQMTLALARRQECNEGFFFLIKDENKLEAALEGTRSILRTLGGLVSSVNLMNTHRVLAMTRRYPKELISERGLISPELVAQLRASSGLSAAWTGLGALYGPRSLVKVARREIRRLLAPCRAKVRFLGSDKLSRLRKILSVTPHPWFKNLKDSLETAQSTLRMIEGRPITTALNLAYWKTGLRPPAGTAMNPAQDGCGLLWFAPLVPNKPDRVRLYTETVKSICQLHGMEPLITLTELSERCIGSSVPLLFDKKNPEETRRAHKCLDQLFEECRSKGFHPYRVGHHLMSKLVKDDSVFWRFADSLKHAVDPCNIIAPGRYSLSNENPSV